MLYLSKWGLVKMPKNIIDKALGVVKKSSSIGKIMMEKSFIEHKRKEKFKNLGELTYSLFKAGNIDNPSFEDLVKDLDDLNTKLRAYSAKLDNF